MREPTGRLPVGLALVQTAKAVNRAFDDELAAAGSTRPVWLILLSLHESELGNQRELAEAVGIRGATLSHHLAAMEADDLVTRQRDPANRRVHQVRLTARGKALFRRLADAVRVHDRQLRRGFSAAEIATLDELLDRMRHNATST